MSNIEDFNNLDEKIIIKIKFEEFRGAEVLIDFTDLDKTEHFKIMWDKEEFDKLALTYSDIEIQEIVLKHVTESIKDSVKNEEV